MNNKKGFTLVELLVVVVILGIITGLSIPLLRNIRQNNELREYTTYMDSMKYSAKLYVESYEEDLFGRHKSGCTIVKYSSLVEKGLLKDIPLSDVSCNSGESFVKIVKIDGKYGYSASVGCGKTGPDGKVVLDVKLPKEGLSSSDVCSVDAKTIMKFTAIPSATSDIKYKKRNVRVSISSDTGINNDVNIIYGFSYNKDTNVINNDWKKLPIEIMGKGAQKKAILDGQTIVATTSNLTTPTGVSGDLYLVLRVDKLENLTNDQWTMDPNQSNYLYFGPYTVDNTKPEFNNSTVVSSVTEYNSTSPKLNLKVTDNLTSANDLRMCISYDSDSCSKNITEMKSGSSYEKYNANKVLSAIKNVYDGSDHKVYVTVVDRAGNYATKSFDYTLGCSITYNSNGGTGTMTDTICNKNTNCTLKTNTFTRDRYEFDGWYTAANGGTQYGATTKLTTNITVYAHWKLMEHKITFNVNGGSAWTKARCEAVTGGVYSNGTCYKMVREQTNYGAMPNPIKSGVYFDRWTTTSSGGNTIGSGTKFTGTTDQTLYAQYGVCTAARYLATGNTIVRWINGNATTYFSEFAVGCERFYVIGYDANTITALAKYNLNLENNAQSQNGFQMTSTAKGGYTAYNEAKTYCNNYGTLLNNSYGLSGIGSGMMTRSLLSRFCSGICYNCYMSCSNSKIYSSYYWGLTVSSAEYPCGKSWCGAERGLRIYDDGQTDVPATNPASNRPGVRPIITIPRNAIN